MSYVPDIFLFLQKKKILGKESWVLSSYWKKYLCWPWMGATLSSGNTRLAAPLLIVKSAETWVKIYLASGLRSSLLPGQLVWYFFTWMVWSSILELSSKTKRIIGKNIKNGFSLLSKGSY